MPHRMIVRSRLERLAMSRAIALALLAQKPVPPAKK